MGKRFAIVDKITGEICDKPGSGIYYVGTQKDMENQPVHEDCMLVELDVDEMAAMQHCGFEVKRGKKTLFVDTIEDIKPDDEILCHCQRNQIDPKKATKTVKERKKPVTVNLYGVHYADEKKEEIIKSRKVSK